MTSPREKLNPNWSRKDGPNPWLQQAYTSIAVEYMRHGVSLRPDWNRHLSTYNGLAGKERLSSDQQKTLELAIGTLTRVFGTDGFVSICAAWKEAEQKKASSAPYRSGFDPERLFQRAKYNPFGHKS